MMSRTFSFLLCLSIVLTIAFLIVFQILFLSRLTVTTAPWTKFPQQRVTEEHRPRPLVACSGAGVSANTRFAVVSMISGAFDLYGLSAMKLAATVRRYSASSTIGYSLSPLKTYIRSHTAGLLYANAKKLENGI